MARGNFGERLKRERELREVTLQEITSATRIGSRFLEALENEDWEKLPGGVFNRGFVRSVARYLGLDEEGLLAEYDLAYGTKLPVAEERPEDRISPPSKWIPLVFVLAVLVLLAGIVAGGIYAWKYLAARRSLKQSLAISTYSAPQTAPPIQPSGAGVNVSQPGVPEAPSAAPLDLFVSTSAATHLTVLSDGNLVFDRDLGAGENRHFRASNGFQVTAADSGAVLLELNGQAMPPLGLPHSSGTMKLSRKDLRQTTGGNPQP